jgi:UMF1 family MFS transporter
MNRRTIASWCLYDFANSFYAALSAVVWQVYYQQAIVGNQRGEGDLWWGRIISLSMLLVALSSPMMGAIADYAGVRKRLLFAYTMISVTAVALFTTVERGMVLWGFAITVISYVAFEGAIVFYNAYLPEIAPPDHQGRVSGWGFAVGYAGSMLALLMSLPLAERNLFDLAFLSIAACFLVFSLPAFLWLPADSPPRMGVVAAAQGGMRESWQTFLEILRLQKARRFLLSYFFYEDGVNTVIYFAAGFAVQTLGFTTPETIQLFLLVQISALLGAFLWSKPTDRLGPKRVVMFMLLQWSVVVTAAYFVQSKTQFFLIALLAGTGLGAIQAASRAFMSTLVAKGREGDFFGFYSLCGKSAAIMGPILFGEVSRRSNQRLAILSVMALFVVGGLLLSRVRAGGPTSVSSPASSSSPS